MSKKTVDIPRDFDSAPPYLTIDEHCALRRESRATCYRKLARGQLEAVKNGARTLIVTASSRADAERMPRATFKGAA